MSEKKGREPSLTYRLAARTLPEVLAGVEAAVSRVGMTRAVTFRGRKFSNEAFLNALVIRALAMPPAELEELLRRGTADYERMIDGGPLPTPGKAAGGGLVIDSGSDAPSAGGGARGGGRRKKSG